jgi:hypothetical protein
MKINKTAFLASTLILALALLTFPSDSAQGVARKTPMAVEITVDTSKVINTMRGGIGASWHAIEAPIPIGHGGSGWGAYPPAEDERAWQQIYRHASWLGLDWNRVEIEQRIYEPERDQFTFESPEMKILYRILDWNQKNHPDVFFQQMWDNTAWAAYPQSANDPIARVHSAPQDLNAFANGLATLMEYLIKKRGYTCIKWLAITNEPGKSWSWWQSPNGPLPIGPGLAAVSKALAQHGLNLPLSGPDNGMDAFPTAVGSEYAPLLGAYDFHDYQVDFDFHTYGYLASQEHDIATWAKLAHDQGKPVFLSEYGTSTYRQAPDTESPSSVESVLVDSEFVIRDANAGVDGFNHWSFLNRGDLDGQWQYIDTWDRNRKQLLTDFAPHPNTYFGLGLLSRFIAKHSDVFSCQVNGSEVKDRQRVFCAAFRSPKGNLTLAIINDAQTDFPLKLTWARTPPTAKFYRYRYAEPKRNRADVKVNSESEFSPGAGSASWQDTLPPESLTIYSTYKLHADDPGIIVDDTANF